MVGMKSRTSYDCSRKQHWLTVYKNGSLGRFLMKDSHQSSSMSESEMNNQVKQSVEKLIEKLDTTQN